MNELDQLTKRLNEVEAQLAHQHETIRDLSDVVTAQWQAIETLQRRVVELTGSLRAAAGAASGADEPPPPHY